MKKCFSVFCIFAVVTIIFVMGCASSPTASSSVSSGSTPQRPIGAEGVPQPDWVRNPKSAGQGATDKKYFVGESRVDAKSITVAKAQARADVIGQLATWKESKAAATLKDYVNESGETGNTQSLETLQQAILAKARANTSGLDEEQEWVAADGHYVLLYSYPVADFKNDFKSATNTFVRNESAAFAEFKAAELFKDLDKELEKD
jgi:hypothetical protein